MTTYKGIKGLGVQSITSDAVADQMSGGTWASGGDLNQARNAAAAGGTQTASIFFGGLEPPPSAKAETYDGSSWTEVGDLNQARYATAGDGTSTASICFA